MEIKQAIKAVLPKTAIGSQKGSAKRVIKPFDKASFAIRITLLALAVLTIYSFMNFDYKDIVLTEAFARTFDNFRKIFFEPRFNHFGLAEALYQVGITLALAFLTTLVGAVIAFFLGLLAAQNLSSKYISNIIKSYVAFIRSVDTVLWVLIFAVAAGLGSAAAVIGMSFHTVGYLVKAYSESFEEIDNGVIEALKASGANWWQVVFQGVIPASITYLLSWTFLRFEINFMNAIAMGAAAGAGGIGFELYMASGHYFDLREVGLITYFILAFAIILETASTKAKRRLQAANS